ncbi:uncharacterized protein [Musca autumnalis]|uniref:uncharacterized protein n=1 Tax=Musca autumnalis TaxID=221902 RepID=UPI003CF98573
MKNEVDNRSTLGPVNNATQNFDSEDSQLNTNDVENLAPNVTNSYIEMGNSWSFQALPKTVTKNNTTQNINSTDTKEVLTPNCANWYKSGLSRCALTANIARSKNKVSNWMTPLPVNKTAQDINKASSNIPPKDFQHLAPNFENSNNKICNILTSEHVNNVTQYPNIESSSVPAKNFHNLVPNVRNPNIGVPSRLAPELANHTSPNLNVANSNSNTQHTLAPNIALSQNNVSNWLAPNSLNNTTQNINMTLSSVPAKDHQILAPNVGNDKVCNSMIPKSLNHPTQNHRNAASSVPSKDLQISAPNVTNSYKGISKLISSNPINATSQNLNTEGSNAAAKILNILAPNIVNINRVNFTTQSKDSANLNCAEHNITENNCKPVSQVPQNAASTSKILNNYWPMTSSVSAEQDNPILALQSLVIAVQNINRSNSNASANVLNILPSNVAHTKSVSSSKDASEVDYSLTENNSKPIAYGVQHLEAADNNATAKGMAPNAAHSNGENFSSQSKDSGNVAFTIGENNCNTAFNVSQNRAFTSEISIRNNSALLSGNNNSQVCAKTPSASLEQCATVYNKTTSRALSSPGSNVMYHGLAPNVAPSNGDNITTPQSKGSGDAEYNQGENNIAAANNTVSSKIPESSNSALLSQKSNSETSAKTSIGSSEQNEDESSNTTTKDLSSPNSNVTSQGQNNVAPIVAHSPAENFTPQSKVSKDAQHNLARNNNSTSPKTFQNPGLAPKISERHNNSSSSGSLEQEDNSSTNEIEKGSITYWTRTRRRTTKNFQNSLSTPNVMDSYCEDSTQHSDSEQEFSNSESEWSGGSENESSSGSSSSSDEDIPLANYKRKRINRQKQQGSKRSFIPSGRKNLETFKVSVHKGNGCKTQKHQAVKRPNYEPGQQQIIETKNGPGRYTAPNTTQGSFECNAGNQRSLAVKPPAIKTAFDFDVSDEEAEDSDNNSKNEEQTNYTSVSKENDRRLTTPKASITPGTLLTNYGTPLSQTKPVTSTNLPPKSALDFDDESSEEEENPHHHTSIGSLVEKDDKIAIRLKITTSASGHFKSALDFDNENSEEEEDGETRTIGSSMQKNVTSPTRAKTTTTTSASGPPKQALDFDKENSEEEDEIRRVRSSIHKKVTSPTRAKTTTTTASGPPKQALDFDKENSEEEDDIRTVESSMQTNATSPARAKTATTSASGSPKQALDFDNENSDKDDEGNSDSETPTSEEEEPHKLILEHSRIPLLTVEDYDNLIAKWKPSLECKLCDVTCSKFTLLREHFAEQHPNSQEGYIECCHKQLRYRYEIVEHIYYHTARAAFKCHLCCVTFYKKSSLIQHNEELHSDSPKPRKTYECKKCGKSFIKLSYFQIHPEFCGGKPKHDQNKTRVVCDICGKSYKDKPDLKVHKAMYHNDERHQCHICDRIFPVKPNLDNHLTRVHTMERAFNCKWCPKNFREPSARLVHYKKVHTDLFKAERANRREQCEQKRYKCTECDKVYRTSFALLEHKISQHEGNTSRYKCKYCSKGYKYSSNLAAHVQRVHPEKYNGKVKK